MNLLGLYIALYVCASVCFFIFAWFPNPPKVNLLGLGIFFWSLVALIKTLEQG